MQFMVYDPNFNPEAATPPTPEMMAEMGQFIMEATQAGAVVATGALNSTGTRLRLSNGKFTVTDGPFIELKELLAGFAIIRVNSLEEAIENENGRPRPDEAEISRLKKQKLQIKDEIANLSHTH